MTLHLDTLRHLSTPISDLTQLLVATTAHSRGSRSADRCRVSEPVARSQASSFWKLAWSASVLGERRHLVVLRQSNLTHLMLAGSLLAANPRKCSPLRNAVRPSSRWSGSLLAGSRPKWR